MKQGEAHQKKVTQASPQQTLVNQLVSHLQSLYPQIPKNLTTQAVNPVLMSSPGPAWGLSYRPGEQRVPTPLVTIDQSQPGNQLDPTIRHELGHQLESLMVRTPERANKFMQILGLTPTPLEDGSSANPRFSKWGLPDSYVTVDKGGVAQNPVELYANIVGTQLGAKNPDYQNMPQIPPKIMGQLINSGLVPIRTPFS